MANSGAFTAWQTGATGRGITVGVVDSGIKLTHQDLAVNISPRSTDIVAGRNNPISPDSHGTRVASVIAAPFNNFGTVGIAYNSTILSVRSDISDCTEPDDTVCFRSSDLANALDYAVANGAKIINLSLGGESPLGASFEAALLRAINAGVVFAIASGNESGANPEWPGRYASDPRFSGGIIVTGAHDATNTITTFSNRAGVSQNFFLSAAGADVIVDCEDTTCWRVSGTSFSAPAVSAALALLLEAFPNLTGRQAIDILLRTGREAGDAGIDSVYGRGLLDIARAFQPVGTTSTPQANGTSVRIGLEPGTFMGGPFGNALSSSPTLATVGYDEYDRLFRINLGAAYASAPRRSYQPENQPRMVSSNVVLGETGDVQLSLAASVADAGPDEIVPRLSPFEAPWLGNESRREAMVSVRAGSLSFAAWQGAGGVRSPFQTGSGDGFTALAQSDKAVRGTFIHGRFALSAETGSGDRRALLRRVEEDASNYARATLDVVGDRSLLSLSVGTLRERLGPLGTYIPSSSDFSLPSETDFASLGGRYRLFDGLTFIGQAGFGRTKINAGRFLNLSEAAVSSTWQIGLQSDCPGWALNCRRLTWSISQPLRIRSGTFSAVLADVPENYFDELTYSQRSFSAVPDGRQIDFSLASDHGLPDGSNLRLEAVMAKHEQHRRDAPLGYAILGSWRRGF